MAEHTIETRILLRYDTYTNWMNSNVILKPIVMSKLFDKIFKETNKGPVENKEKLCDSVCSTLAKIIDDRGTIKDKRLIVWLECEQQIVCILCWIY